MDIETVSEDARQRVASNIVRLSKRRGLSISRLADFAGVSRPHLSRVINGKAEATVRWLARIAFALDVDVVELLVAHAPRKASRSKPRRERAS